ncbi:flagellar type III secretion system pore protein FliP [Schlesneria paludicola]|uniref:flagellar type III secretion system pore protein FliP n=1 Tax=Schlesneria paludicola TaxID=360056 RepID=UPI00029B52B8|nr:flagellar type III secretion system pore protein FliP [Schlesneria paludicola]
MSNVETVAERLAESGLLQNLSPPLQMAIFLGSLVLLPAALSCLTCFTRIAIVMSFVRRGLSTQEIPPNTVLIGLSLFLTIFIMEPTLTKLNDKSVLPYLNGELTGIEAIRRGIEIHKGFMLRQTRKHDLALFAHMSKSGPIQTPQDTPISVLIPAFIISELKTAFVMGFCIYIPFLLVDLVVSTVLMSMGMMMMPPVIISTPFKILLFVLADGWHLVSLSLSQSFG